MRRYGLLFLIALAAAGLLGRVFRVPLGAAPERVAARPAAALRLELVADGVAASTGSIPVGAEVRLEVRNARRDAARVQLAGYEDRVDSGRLAPGDSVAIAFVADRPGERFAWLVDGAPTGRLDIVGSHLVNGHR